MKNLFLRSGALVVRPFRTLLAACGLLALLLASTAPALAQTTPAWQSALAPTQTTAAGTATTRATAVDAASGAVFVTGSFTGQVAFGSTTLTSLGSDDVFVARYEPGTATWAWATRAGGSGGSDAGTGIATDGTNVYVTGYFASSAGFFAGQPAAVTLTGTGDEVFVAAYAATAGTGVWARRAGGSGGDQGLGVAVGGGRVYVTGYFTGSAAFFAGQPAATTLSGGNLEIFVAAYTAGAGTGVWAKSAGGTTDNDLGEGIATDGTNVYVTGRFAYNATFFAGQPAATSLTGAGFEAFVAAYTASTGTGVWAKSAGGGGSGAGTNDLGQGIATDGTNVYVTGLFENSGTFFAGQSAATTLTGTGFEVFVASYVAGTGAGRWARRAGGSGQDIGRGIATDGTTVYVTGNFVTSAGFFAGQPAAVTLTGTGDEVFVAAYTATAGTGVWASKAGGTGTDTGFGVAVGSAGVYAGIGTGNAVATFGSATVPPNAAALGTLDKTTGAWQGATACLTASGNAQVRGTAVDKTTGAVFVTGDYTGQVAFGSTVLTSAGGNDVFVARYTPATAAWAWATRGGGAGSDVGQGIAADGQGGVYVTGYFDTNATFAGQPALSGAGLEVFVVAYAAADGTGRWTKSGGGAGTDVGQGIAADGQGGVYATGYFSTSGTFAGQPALSGTGAEVFVAAYAAADGTGRWAKSGGGPNADNSQGIAADGQGGVYVTGYFTTSGTFAGQPALSGAGIEAFVAAYAAADGAGRWAKSGGGTSTDAGYGIAADGQGGVYATGYFTTSGTFAGQPALNGAGAEMFVAAYAAADGTGRWAKSGGGAGNDTGFGIAADEQGGVYATGFFVASGTFAGQPALNGTGGEVFVAAYAASNGTGRWAKSGGGAGTDIGQGIATDGTRLYVGGYVALPATFGSITLAGTNSQVGVLAGLTLPPALVSLSATSGAAGSTLGATGGALGGLTAVTFTPASGPATNAASGYTSTATSISNITVPAGLAAGAYTVTVTNANGTSNGLAFTVTVPPLLLVSTAPARNAGAAARPTNVALTFNQPLNPATAGNVRVFSAQYGGQLVRGGNATASGAVLTVDPATNLQPGEVVQVSVPATVTSAAGGAAARQVFQFTAAAGGTGRGNFRGTGSVGAGLEPYAVAAADVDNDGDLDLLVANNGTGANSVSVRRNDGTGTFTGSTDVPVSTPPNLVVAADVDGDGDLDMLTANFSSSTVRVRLNDGTGTFSGTGSVNVGTFPACVAVGDVDGDGDLDLLTANNGNSTVSVRRNNGTGTFSGGSTVPVGTNPKSVVLADVDNDGDLDLLTADLGAGTASVGLNDGTGTFGSVTSVAVGDSPNTVAAADVDNDGDLDLLVTNGGSGGGTGNSVSVRFNNGTGTFTGTTDVAVGNRPYGLATADVDADGDLDLLVPNGSDNTVSVRLNNGSGTFGGGAEVPVGTAPHAVAAADVDGDGDLDLLTADSGTGNTVSVRFNQPLAPVLASLTATSGASGSTLGATGGALGGLTSVTFTPASGPATTAASGYTSTATSISNVTVPAGLAAGVYTVTVTNANGTSNGLAYTVTLPVPAISSFNPTSGPVGTPVALTGTGLSGATAVSFNGGLQTTITANTATGLTAAVPAGSSNGAITLATAGGVATSTRTPVLRLQSANAGIFDRTVYLDQVELLDAADAIVPGGVANGSFETGAPAGTITFGPTGVTGWTFDSGTAISTTASPYFPPASPDGTAHVALLQTVGRYVEQTLNLTANGPYRVRFQLAQRQCCGGGPYDLGVQVLLNGVALGATLTNTGAGYVQVVSAPFTATTAGIFAVTVPPAITGFSPASGLAGTPVTFTGTNLGSVTGVRFGTGSLTTNFVSQSATSLTVLVPVTSSTGVVTLTNNIGLSGSTATNFTYVPRQNLTATLSPAGPLNVCAARTLTATASSPAFATGTGLGNGLRSVAVQADGKVLAGGFFTSYNGTAANCLIRLNADGSPDAGFVTGTGFNIIFNTVNSVAVQADGKVLAGGSFTSYNGTTGQNNLIRLNADGSRDATFATGTGFNNAVNSVAVQADGKVLVGGNFTSYNGTTGLNYLVRLNADGSHDATFTTGTGFDNGVYGVAVQADGRVLAGGFFASYNGTAGQNKFIRLNADGSRDATFVTGAGFDQFVASVAVQADDKVLVGGRFTSYNGTTGLNRLVRLNADGSRDATFATGTGFNDIVRSVAVQADGRVLAGGDFASYNGTAGLNYLVRLNADGSRDAGFATGTGFSSPVYGVAVQADGQVLAGGDFTAYRGVMARYLVRLNADGSRNAAPTAVAGASFTFAPGGSTTNPLVTNAPGSYTATASLNGETSASSNAVVLSACPVPAVSGLNPTSGPVGTAVTITGTNFTAGSAVSFNGTAASAVTFTSATSLTATVPPGATTGNVSVTTANGTSNGVAFTVTTAPTVTTATPTGTTASSAVLGGNVTGDGGDPVTDRGVVYVAGTGTPSIGGVGSTQVSIGAGTGSFSGNPSGLAAGTTYTVRAYATNGVGTSYGSSATFATAAATAAPVVTAPAHVSLTNDNTPTYAGTGPAGSAITVAVDGATIGSTTATAGGTWSLTQPIALADGTHTVNATATANGSTSAASNTNGFTVDATVPTVAIGSAAGSPTSTAPIPVTVTFSENVTGFVLLDVAVTNGTASNFAGSGAGYTFDVTPATSGVVAVNIAANAATDPAGNGNTAAPAFSLTYTATAVRWNGSVSSSWFDPANWTPAQVPTAALYVSIDNAARRMPALTTAAAAQAGTLTIEPGATLTHTLGTLTLSGDFRNDGTYALNPDGSGGTLVVGGTAPADLQSSAATTFANLTVLSFGASLVGPSTGAARFAVTQVLALTGDLTTGGHPFTLRSTATGTALVVNSGTGVVNGPATVQRYLTTANPGLGYRHYSSPVRGNNMADLATATFTPVFDAAYNTRATAHPVAGFPTVLGYDQARLATAASPYTGFDKGWFSLLATDAFVPGTGYAVNLRGTELVDFTGTLNTGDYARALPRATGAVGGEGLHLVGNPYPAPIDWSLVTTADRPGMDAAFYVFESSSQYGGSYRSAVNGVGSSSFIGSSQGFFVRVTPGQTAGTLTFRNAHRLTDYAQQVAVRRGAADTRPLVQLALAGTGASDNVFVYAEAGATAGVDAAYDAAKLANPSGLNLSSAAATGEALAIDGRAAFAVGTVIPLQVSVPAAGAYACTAQLSHLPAGLSAYLVDNATGTRRLLLPGMAYAFTAAAAGSLAGRFVLAFGPAAGPLAATTAATEALLTLAPNPARSAVTLALPAAAQARAVTVADALGRVVRKTTLPAQAATLALDLAGLASGVYTVRCAAATARLLVE